MAATPVAPVSAAASVCTGCGAPATWQVGPTIRSYTRHVGSALEVLHAVDPRPFAPPLPVPLKRGHW
jgi:hypothetical protein